MNDIQKEIAEKYQEFFNFMNQEHELILTMGEMDEIVFEAQRLFKKLTIPAVVGQSEQLSICKKCGSSEMYQYTKTKDKCEDCGNIQDY